MTRTAQIYAYFFHIIKNYLSKFQILGDELTEKSKPNDIASQVGDTK